MAKHTDPEEKFRWLTTAPIPGLVGRLAVPTVISMLITSIYNMADTYFVGNLGTSAQGAVGVVFSLMAIIQAIGFTFGNGSGNYVSRLLGQQRREEAETVAATGFFSGIAVGLALALGGLVFLDPLVSLLGATDTILPYAREYARYILIGAPWMVGSFVLNNLLRFEGSAAYATIISQAVSFLILLYNSGRGGTLPIRIRRYAPGNGRLGIIIRGGLPSMYRQGLASVASILLNWAAKPYLDAAQAAMAIVSKVTMFAGSAMIGFGQGFQPVCGFNYGAKLHHRVKEGFWFCVKTSAVFLLAVSALGITFAPRLIAVFRDDPEVIAIGTAALRAQCLTLCFSSWIVMSNMMLQTIGKTAGATFLAMSRQGIFFIPLVYLLSMHLGLLGVEVTQSAADLLTLLFAVPIQMRALRELDWMERGKSIG